MNLKTSTFVSVKCVETHRAGLDFNNRKTNE